MNKTRFIIFVGIGLILFVYFFPPLTKSKFHEPIKSFFWGIILILGSCWFVYETAGNPLHELALIQHGKTTQGFIIDTFEDVGETDYGKTVWTHYVIYEYSLPNGKKLNGRLGGNGRLATEFQDLTEPYPIEVEYLPSKPSISRIKGSGCQSMFELLWRKVGIGSILLIGLGSIGFTVLKNGITQIMNIQKNVKKEN